MKIGILILPCKLKLFSGGMTCIYDINGMNKSEVVNYECLKLFKKRERGEKPKKIVSILVPNE